MNPRDSSYKNLITYVIMYLITDLINTIDEDLKQLDYIKSEMNRSSKIINEIQCDISSRKNILTQKQIIDKLTETNVSYSYFAQKGIFNQLIATGSFELIEKQELKLLLLKIYNHQNDKEEMVNQSKNPNYRSNYSLIIA